MPHIIVKLWPGSSDVQKTRLTEAITREVCACLDKNEASVSIAFEEIRREDWADRVIGPDILAHPERLTKPPGYQT